MSITKLGRGVVVRGTIRGEGDVAIEGRVEGQIDVSGDVTVEGRGRVKAPIAGDRINVFGAVAGEIRGVESVVLEAGAQVVGDLHAPNIGIRPGGLLRGYVSTAGKAAPAGASKRAAQRPADRAVATPAPRAQRPASLARGRDEVAATAPARGATPTREAPPREAPVREAPPARPAPPPPRTNTTTRPSFVEPIASPLTRASGRAAGGPPPPVVPALKKGAKGAMKKKVGK